MTVSSPREQCVMGTMSSLIISYWSSAKNKPSHTAPQSGSCTAGCRQDTAGRQGLLVGGEMWMFASLKKSGYFLGKKNK